MNKILNLEKIPIKRKFFYQDTNKVAKDILGKLLIRETSQNIFLGRIVETEAYRGYDDPASHAFRGKTKRNEIMFGKPGVLYVYFTYGTHYCLNIVTEKKGIAAAVLIRSIEPIQGIDKMKKNRGTDDLKKIANGPGKLTKAFQITLNENGLDVTKKSSYIKIYETNKSEEFKIIQTTRIGIRFAKEFPWRFYIQDNPYVSKK